MILAPALLLSFAQAPDAPSTAEPWRTLGEAGNGISIFYDPAPAARAGDTLTARLLARFRPGSEADPAYAISTVEIRCAANQARVTRTTNRRADGNVTSDDTDVIPFDPIRENSLFATLRRALC